MSLALEWKGREYTIRGDQGHGGRVDEARSRKRAAERRRLRVTFSCFLGVAAFLCGLFILNICLQVMVVQNEIKVREVERKIDLERRLHEGIRLEIASLESPARVEQVAREHLGMIQVTHAEYLETPAYHAARMERENKLSDGEGMVSDATQGKP